MIYIIKDENIKKMKGKYLTGLYTDDPRLNSFPWIHYDYVLASEYVIRITENRATWIRYKNDKVSAEVETDELTWLLLRCHDLGVLND